MKTYRPINLSLSPNTEEDDIALAERLIQNPDKWLKGPEVKKLEENIKDKLGVDHAFAFRSGRSALQAAIETLHLERNDEILIQSFTCVAVPNAIIWNGYKPVYVDIEEDFNISTTDILRKLTPKTRAIIVQHTFGLPAKMDEIMTIAKERKLVIIEDCAHALGATYKDKPVGTIGDIGIFSFGRDKVISSVFGGMAVTKNELLATELKNIKTNSPLPTQKWVKRQLFHPLLLNKYVLPNYAKFNIGKYILALAVKFGIISKAVCAQEKLGKKAEELLGQMPNALASLTNNQLKKLDKFNEHRKKIAALYDKEFKELKIPVEIPKQDKDTQNIYLRYSIKTDKAKEIILAGRKSNILLDNWYNPSIAPAGTDNEKIFYDPASCPNALYISKRVLNLPTNINTSEEDAKKVIKLIKKYLHEHRD